MKLYSAVLEMTFSEPELRGHSNRLASPSRRYRDTLVRAIGELANGPEVGGSKARDEIMRGLRTLHVARHGRRGRHFLLYRVAPGRIIEIGRILHGGMDMPHHRAFRRRGVRVQGC
jgi:plasmid stabilization system protein ParE